MQYASQDNSECIDLNLLRKINVVTGIIIFAFANKEVRYVTSVRQEKT